MGLYKGDYSLLWNFKIDCDKNDYLGFVDLAVMFVLLIFSEI
jgi:hypothetical protein